MAIMAALLAGVLCLVAAFALDFGLAYNSKQRLQTAADAGALAAAQVYKGQAGACPTFIGNTALKAQAQAAANHWAEMNRPGAAGTPIQVSCDGDRAIKVSYGTSGSTIVTLGQLAVDQDTITTSRAAEAMIGERVEAAGGMRPWGVCANVVGETGNVVFVPLYNSSTSTHTSAALCGSESPPGGWWVAGCQGQGNSTGSTEAAVLSGCATSDYRPVAGQPSDPQGRYDHLVDECSYTKGKKDIAITGPSCLGSDNGNNFHNASEEWQTLVGKTFALPVFCTRPACSEMAFIGQGNNASYPIHAMVEVELCGFEMQPRAPSTGWPTSGPCATRNPSGYTSADVTSGAGFFLVVKKIYRDSWPNPSWTLTEYEDLRLTQ